MAEQLKNFLEWVRLILYLILFLIITASFIDYWFNDKPKSKKLKKARRRIAKKLDGKCYFCEKELDFTEEEKEDGIKRGLVPFCYTCSGKLEKYEELY